MAGGQERVLRRRIRSVQATKKITKAMELIAASQISRAQNRISANRPYRAGMARIVVEAARADRRGGEAARHPEQVNSVWSSPSWPTAASLARTTPRCYVPPSASSTS